MTTEEIIELYDSGVNQKTIAQDTGMPVDQVYKIIGAVLEKRKNDRIKSLQAVNRKPEVGIPVEYDGHTYYDYTDLFIDRPCICAAPDLQNEV